MFFLAFKNIVRRLGSSLATISIVAITIAVAVAGSASYIGISQGVILASERLGADIIVLPEALGVSPQEALFTAEPANIYLPENSKDIVAGVPGVEGVTPQFFTQTLNQSCCSIMGVTRVVGIDLSTDFVIKPWLSDAGIDSLADDEIILGANAPDVPGNVVSILGTPFYVRARLAETGTSVDETVFMNLEVARSIGADSPYLQGVWTTTDPYSSISAIMVKVASNADPEQVALDISSAYPSASVTAVSGLVKSTSEQLDLLVKSFGALTLAILAIAIIALAGRFSALMKERGVEIGFMRSVGYSSRDCLVALLVESELLSGIGGVIGSLVGVAVAVPLAASFHRVLALPQTGIDISSQIGLWAVGVAIALLLGFATSTRTALKYSHMDPQVALQKGGLQ